MVLLSILYIFSCIICYEKLNNSLYDPANRFYLMNYKLRYIKTLCFIPVVNILIYILLINKRI